VRAGPDAWVCDSSESGLQTAWDGHVHWLDNGASRVASAGELVAR